MSKPEKMEFGKQKKILNSMQISLKQDKNVPTLQYSFSKKKKLKNLSSKDYVSKIIVQNKMIAETRKRRWNLRNMKQL